MADAAKSKRQDSRIACQEGFLTRIKPQRNQFRVAQLCALGLIRLQELGERRGVASFNHAAIVLRGARPRLDLPLGDVYAALPDDVIELTLGCAHQRRVVGRRERSI
jgi:hypothetical protein